MTENKAGKTQRDAQEHPKKEKTYKVTCGTFKAQNEALQKAVEARKAGINVSLTIKQAEYSLLYAENMTKEEAEMAKKAIEEKKIKAEISEQ